MLYSKDKNIQLSTHFWSKEFSCPCDDCKQTLIDKILVSQLEAMRTILGSKLRITSGYRCQDYQDQLALRGYETSKNSQHLLGKAADVTNGVSPGHELEDAARRAGFLAVGVGSNWVHVDLRGENGKQRRWIYRS